jgi:hypothetical protein
MVVDFEQKLKFFMIRTWKILRVQDSQSKCVCVCVCVRERAAKLRNLQLSQREEMISLLPGLGLQLLAAVVLLWRLCSFGDDGVCIWDRRAPSTQNVLLTIDGRAPLASIDVAFLCATLDWWPPDKCDYGTCSWGNDSMLNLVFYNWPLCVCVRAEDHLIWIGDEHSFVAAFCLFTPLTSAAPLLT